MRRGALAALLLLLARGAAATDVELRLESVMQYDDNVLSSATDKLSDTSLRLTPQLRILDETGDLNWEIRYAPRYRYFIDLDEFNGWDQDAYGKLKWKINERTTLTLSDWYTDYASFDRLLTEQVQQNGTIDTGFDLGQQRSQQNNLEGSLFHNLTRRSSLELSVSRYDTDYELPETSDTWVTSGTLSYLYDWDPTDRVGVLVRATQQTVESLATDRPDLDTNYYNVSLQWMHLFDPTWTLSASVGPTWVDADLAPIPDTIRNVLVFPTLQGPGFAGPLLFASCPVIDGLTLFATSCQPIPPVLFSDLSFLAERGDLPEVGSHSNSASDLTYFATVSLVKQWVNYSLTLRYLRDASNTSQVSGVIRDVISATATWDPTEPWRVSLSAFYELREQSATGRNSQVVLEPVTAGGFPGVARASGFRLVEVKRNTSANRIFVSLYAQYDMTRSTSLFGTVFWSREQLTVDVLPVRVTDRFGVWLGVRYTFPRYQLPI